MSEEVEYDPVMVQWMRENTEPVRITKPSLAKALAEGRIPVSLSDSQEEHLLALIEAAKVDEPEAA